MPWPDARATGEVVEGDVVAHNIHHAFRALDRMAALRCGASVAADLGPRTSSIEDAESTITGEELRA